MTWDGIRADPCGRLFPGFSYDDLRTSLSDNGYITEEQVREWMLEGKKELSNLIDITYHLFLCIFLHHTH